MSYQGNWDKPLWTLFDPLKTIVFGEENHLRDSDLSGRQRENESDS